MLARDAAASLPRPTPVRPVRPAPPPELGVAAPGRLSAFAPARQPPIRVQPGGLPGPAPESDQDLTAPPASGRRRPAPASEGLRGCEGAAIEGWLAGLGLERYAELLLRAGWDSVEVTCACHISVSAHCMVACLGVHLRFGKRPGQLPATDSKSNQIKSVSNVVECLFYICIHCGT